MGKRHNKFIGLTLAASLSFVLGACSNNTNEAQSDNQKESKEVVHMDDNSAHSEMEHSGNHTGSANITKKLHPAKNPVYKVGSAVVIQEGHMKGMQGAKATIKGAYDTIVYTVSYKTSNSDEMVRNHKWVIHEEIKDAGKEALKPGTKVKLNAEHMEGMNGVTATIDSAEKTTVYMVDYIPTTGGEKVTNHKWVTESELAPVK